MKNKHIVKTHKCFPLAVHIALLHNDKVLLQRRQNTGYEDGNFGVIAGHLDGGETVIQAAIREVREEVGVQIDPSHIQLAGVLHRISGGERVEFFLIADIWKGRIINAEPDKCDMLGWFPINNLPPNTISHVAKALHRSYSHLWFSETDWDDKVI